MLRLTLEVIHSGDQSHKSEIGTITIDNITPDQDPANYRVVWHTADGFSSRPIFIKGHEREGAWLLAHKALGKLFIGALS